MMRWRIFFEHNKVDMVVSLPSIDKCVCDAVCNAKGVVDTLQQKFALLKEHHLFTTINVVLTRLNINTLYDTLKAIGEWGFVSRVGMAQKPINASKKYMQYALNKNDFDAIVRQTIKAQDDFGLDIDFSVCLPDCAFASRDDYRKIRKGDCLAGTIAYAICTNGDVKACQCDTKTYGNILTDSFEDIYKNMSPWRNGSMIPVECLSCSRLRSCRAGCRAEAYANNGDYRSLSTFADPKSAFARDKDSGIIDFADGDHFRVSDNVQFLKDKSCYRVSVGIVAAYLSDEFAIWLTKNKEFSFHSLMSAASGDRSRLAIVLDMLLKNGIVTKR